MLLIVYAYCSISDFLFALQYDRKEIFGGGNYLVGA